MDNMNRENCEYRYCEKSFFITSALEEIASALKEGVSVNIDYGCLNDEVYNIDGFCIQTSHTVLPECINLYDYSFILEWWNNKLFIHI